MPAGGFEGFGARQTARLNTLKNRWPWRVAARVALERPAEGFEGFGARGKVSGRANGKLKRSVKQSAVAWVARESSRGGAAAERLTPLRFGKPLKHRQAFVSGTTLGKGGPWP